MISLINQSWQIVESEFLRNTYNCCNQADQNYTEYFIPVIIQCPVAHYNTGHRTNCIFLKNPVRNLEEKKGPEC